MGLIVRLLPEMPLSDDERAAVDGDVQALDRLLAKLKDVSPPRRDGPVGRGATIIPLIAQPPQLVAEHA